MKKTLSERHWWFLGLGLAIVLIGWSNSLELRAEEPRRAIVSLEMAMEGHWLRPEIHDYPYYNKPPLFNWIQSLFIHLTGSAAEWVVRLPGLLSFLLLGWFSFRFTDREWSRELSTFGAFAFLTSGHLLFYGTVNAGEIDLFLSLVIFGQVACIYRGESGQRLNLLFLGSYFLAAVGAMAKGLPSIAVQGLTLFIYLWIKGRWRWLLSGYHLAGIALFLALLGSYLTAYYQGDDAIAFLVRQFKEASQRTGFETHWIDTLKGFFQFPLDFLLLIAPWSLGLVLFIDQSIRRAIWNEPLSKFLLIFLAVNLPLYWITGDHKSRYVYPFLAPACLLLARVWWLAATARPSWFNRLKGFLQIILALVTLAAFVLPFIPIEASIPSLVWTAPLIGLALAYCLWHFYQYTDWAHFFWLFRWLILGRLLFNLVYFPIQQQRPDGRRYRAAVERLLTVGSPIYWTGPPYHYQSDASLGSYKVTEVKLTSAPLITYQIPYYLTRKQGEVMRYHEQPQAGNWYLSQGEVWTSAGLSLSPKLMAVDSIQDRWINQTLYLWYYEDR
ncbi:MAG: glycosyltransferase family 39 protein [Bacteroidota bacterium]